MIVRCAWCEKEGLPADMGDKEGPKDDVSHSICDRHQEAMLKEILSTDYSNRNPMRRRRKRRVWRNI